MLLDRGHVTRPDWESKPALAKMLELAPLKEGYWGRSWIMASHPALKAAPEPTGEMSQSEWSV